jgi:UbiD family decarboxylase
MGPVLPTKAIVDTNIDIRDPSHVDWTLNVRFNPVRDTVIIDDVQLGNIDRRWSGSAGEQDRDRCDREDIA